MRRSRTMSFLTNERSRESFDSNSCSASPSLSIIKRRYSGTPQLPPLTHRQTGDHGKSEPETGSRVVFTIEEIDTYEDPESNYLRIAFHRIPLTWHHYQTMSEALSCIIN
ncbi:3',5'-cyclic-AMP phosphodiesterase 4C-like [Rhinoderma darwinii]|uniref:3',5'-cyclic-AMP phosphodiesterase 4C-like n=1 Tax=Rhinoderma darwinii TaxID=43563 RepID=UPI003F67F887